MEVQGLVPVPSTDFTCPSLKDVEKLPFQPGMGEPVQEGPAEHQGERSHVGELENLMIQKDTGLLFSFQTFKQNTCKSFGCFYRSA